jgi:hypothetical protein
VIRVHQLRMQVRRWGPVLRCGFTVILSTNPDLEIDLLFRAARLWCFARSPTETGFGAERGGHCGGMTLFVVRRCLYAGSA